MSGLLVPTSPTTAPPSMMISSLLVPTSPTTAPPSMVMSILLVPPSLVISLRPIMRLASPRPMIRPAPGAADVASRPGAAICPRGAGDPARAGGGAAPTSWSPSPRSHPDRREPTRLPRRARTHHRRTSPQHRRRRRPDPTDLRPHHRGSAGLTAAPATDHQTCSAISCTPETAPASHPACRAPAARTDIDHVEPYKPGQTVGGPTDVDNLALPVQTPPPAPKTAAGSRLRHHPNTGDWTWTTPLGPQPTPDRLSPSGSPPTPVRNAPCAKRSTPPAPTEPVPTAPAIPPEDAVASQARRVLPPDSTPPPVLNRESAGAWSQAHPACTRKAMQAHRPPAPRIPWPGLRCPPCQQGVGPVGRDHRIEHPGPAPRYLHCRRQDRKSLFGSAGRGGSQTRPIRGDQNRPPLTHMHPPPGAAACNGI